MKMKRRVTKCNFVPEEIQEMNPELCFSKSVLNLWNQGARVQLVLCGNSQVP